MTSSSPPPPPPILSPTAAAAAAAVAAGVQTDLDEQGIAKNARQEKIAARAATNGADEKFPADEKDAAYHEQMGALYRQHVLKEEKSSLVQIQGLGKKEDESVGPN